MKRRITTMSLVLALGIATTASGQFPTASKEHEILKLEDASQAGGPGPQRDVFTYRLTIGEGAAARTFAFDDASAPAAVRPLLNALRELAMAERLRQ